MLQHKKRKMDNHDWASFVRHTKKSIINSPDEYVYDVPDPSKSNAVHQLFDEFGKKHKI